MVKLMPWEDWHVFLPAVYDDVVFIADDVLWTQGYRRRYGQEAFFVSHRHEAKVFAQGKHHFYYHVYIYVNVTEKYLFFFFPIPPLRFNKCFLSLVGGVWGGQVVAAACGASGSAGRRRASPPPAAATVTRFLFKAIFFLSFLVTCDLFCF